MIYTLIGKAVVKAARLYLRRRYGYGSLHAPKPILAGAVVVAVLVAALLGAKREAE